LNKKKGLAVLGITLVSLMLFANSLTYNIAPQIKPGQKPFLYFETWTEYSAMPYDQGIYRIYVAFNDTGSWVEMPGADPLEYNDDVVLNMNVSVSCRITVRHTLNKTLLGFGGAADARLLYRLKVTVTNQTGTTIFTQQNGTNTDFDALAGLIYYNDCQFVLNFLSDYAQVYNVTLDYDTFW